jgi:hypothetical protein
MTKLGPPSVGISAQIPQGMRDQIDEFGRASHTNLSESVRRLLHNGLCTAAIPSGTFDGEPTGISVSVPLEMRNQIDEFGTANKANRSEAIRLLLHRGLAAWAAVKAQHAPP